MTGNMHAYARPDYLKMELKYDPELRREAEKINANANCLKFVVRYCGSGSEICEIKVTRELQKRPAVNEVTDRTPRLLSHFRNQILRPRCQSLLNLLLAAEEVQRLRKPVRMSQ